MNEITTTLNRLRETNSTNEKKQILIETKSDLFEKIFIQAYNSFINFGVTKIDTSDIVYTNELSTEEWLEHMFVTLQMLANRELTGNAARDTVKELMSKTTEEDAELVLLILRKDLRTGTGVRLINKVYIDLLPEGFCMGANKYEAKRVTFPVYADTKLDGVRCIAMIEDSISLKSRNGKPFNNYKSIECELTSLELPPGLKLDGEITMGHFQDLMRTLGKKTDGIELSKDAIYNIFDIQLTMMKFEDRLKELDKLSEKIEKLGLTHVRIIKGEYFENEESLLRYYGKQLDAGEEGAMIKTLDGLYEYKRTYAWQKMKPEHTEDLEIVGIDEGKGKYVGQLGAFICQLDNGDTVNVGSGLKDEERIDLWPRREELIGKLIEVKFQEKTKDGSMRFPIFMRFREDKT